MAVKRGKSQARRNSGNNSSGLPGWAWLVLGVVLTLGVILAAPRFLKSEGQDGFFRPRPNPDARPAAANGDADDDGVVPEPASTDAERATAAARGEQASEETQFDFYTLLPGKEVAMSDAELAASTREEAARAQREQAQQAAAAQRAGGTTPTGPSQAGTTTPSIPATGTAATTTPATAVAVAGNDTRYILQAGAFGASGDAEALKARIALLGLGARVESASINGKTMYRVRMGPYGTASELAEAKGKLGNGGLPAMAIKVK